LPRLGEARSIQPYSGGNAKGYNAVARLTFSGMSFEPALSRLRPVRFWFDIRGLCDAGEGKILVGSGTFAKRRPAAERA
jgi:hypothetical protein